MTDVMADCTELACAAAPAAAPSCLHSRTAPLRQPHAAGAGGTAGSSENPGDSMRHQATNSAIGGLCLPSELATFGRLLFYGREINGQIGGLGEPAC
jgi:hypothetical protein